MGKQKFMVRGPKKKSKNNKSETVFEKDKRLEIKIVKTAPFLMVRLTLKIIPRFKKKDKKVLFSPPGFHR